MQYKKGWINLKWNHSYIISCGRKIFFWNIWLATELLCTILGTIGGHHWNNGYPSSNNCFLLLAIKWLKWGFFFHYCPQLCWAPTWKVDHMTCAIPHFLEADLSQDLSATHWRDCCPQHLFNIIIKGDENERQAHLTNYIT